MNRSFQSGAGWRFRRSGYFACSCQRSTQSASPQVLGTWSECADWTRGHQAESWLSSTIAHRREPRMGEKLRPSRAFRVSATRSASRNPVTERLLRSLLARCRDGLSRNA